MNIGRLAKQTRQIPSLPNLTSVATKAKPGGTTNAKPYNLPTAIVTKRDKTLEVFKFSYGGVSESVIALQLDELFSELLKLISERNLN